MTSSGLTLIWSIDCNSSSSNTSLLIYFTLNAEAVSTADKHIASHRLYTPSSVCLQLRWKWAPSSASLRVGKIKLAGIKNSVNTQLVTKYVQRNGNQRLLLHSPARRSTFLPVSLQWKETVSMMHFSAVIEKEVGYELSDAQSPPPPPLRNEILLIAFVTVWEGREMFYLQTWWLTVISEESAHHIF